VLQSSQQINTSKPFPNCKEIAIKTTHTTTMCNDIVKDKCNIKRQVVMSITGKHFAYLVETASSKKKSMSLPYDDLSMKVERCPCVVLLAFDKAT
jgi:hypothetical protein